MSATPEGLDLDQVVEFKQCCWQGLTDDVERMLTDYPGIVDEIGTGSPNSTGLCWAVEYRQLETVYTLLRGGASTTSLAGTEALIKAVRTGSVALVSLMLKHGADPNAVGPTGQAAIHVAVIKSWETGPERFQVVSLLLHCGADPNCVPNAMMHTGLLPKGVHHYGTPTQLAVAWARRRVALLLAIYGADRHTPLEYKGLDGIRRLPLSAIAKEAECPAELVDAISIGAHAAWSAQRYLTYQGPLRAAIKTLLLVQHRLKALEQTRLVAMPPEMWTLINGFVLPRQWPSVVRYSKPA